MIEYIKKLSARCFGSDQANILSIEKTPIVIWGCNAFSECLYNILIKDGNIDVIAFIENPEPTNKFCNRPVYSPQEFKSIGLTSVPIVIASPHIISNGLPVIDFESIYQYKIKMQEIINVHGIENHLLHSSALVDLVSVKYPNKIIQFGLPGSGITFLSHICLILTEKNPNCFQTKDNAAIFFERMCHEYVQCIHQIIPDIAHLHDGFDFHMSCWKIGTTFAICTFENIRMEIYSFPTRNHVIGPVYNYHHIPGEKYLDRLALQKYKLIFNRRNPLDVIVSCVNKAGGIDKNSQKIDMSIFCDVSRWVIGQLNKWSSLPFLSGTFSYDNLIKDPVLEIKNLMHRLDIPSSTVIAKQVWEQLSFKQLPSAPKSHFWRGGTGKWEGYFKKEHISFLKEHGIEQVMENWNYLDELSRFKNYSHVSSHEWRGYCEKKLLEKMEKPVKCIYEDENQDTLKFIQDLHGESSCVVGDGFYIAGKDPERSQKIKKMLNSKYINKIILSGAHPAQRII